MINKISNLPKDYKLVDSTYYPGTLRSFMTSPLTSLLGPVKPDIRYELPQPLIFPDHINSKLYGIAHIGIMIPDLPPPHYFLACASMIGQAGLKVFDVDCAVDPKDGPRNTTVLCHGTAEAVEGHFTRYSNDQMTGSADGSILKFGDDLTILGQYPNFKLESKRHDFEVNLELTATGEITWFAKSLIYKHMGLLTKYKGTITSKGKVQEVSGLCTYEYAYGQTPYVFRNKLLSRSKKIPWDFFSYQIINLDSETQIMLTHSRMSDRPALTSAYLRKVGSKEGLKGLRLNADVVFKVKTLQEQPAIAPDKRITFLPEDFLWRVTDNDGNSILEIEATVDTPMLFGLGQGYIGGYKWSGKYQGKEATGRGYIEYVDQRYD